MHYDMAVLADSNPISTFMRQMIPHHLNAIEMAKLTLKHSSETADFGGDEAGYDVFVAMLHAIVNAERAGYLHAGPPPELERDQVLPSGRHRRRGRWRR